MRLAILLAILLAAPFVNAIAEITYKFPIKNVEIEAYDCLNNDCSQTRQFSGTFPQGTTTNNGQITIKFPSTLATSQGYAIYYFSKGYLPEEARATWHTFGNQGIAKATINIPIEKKAVCRAVIDNFEIINDAHANLPLKIDVSASLNADTHSAFALSDNDVTFIPEHRKKEFYSVDTRVKLKISDENENTINEQSAKFERENALFAGTKAKTQFTFLPIKESKYKATVQTEITDNQCQKQESQTSTKEFIALSDSPRNECYTILNNLRTTKEEPFTIGFTKISNKANEFPINDQRYGIMPVPTEIQYKIKDTIQTEELSANPDSINPTTHTKSFVLQPGKYEIEVTAKAKGQCTKNTPETMSMTFTIPEKPRFNLTMQVLNNKGKPVDNAVIVLGEKTKKTDNGIAKFLNLIPGAYAYTISHQSGKDAGQIRITNTNLFFTTTLQPKTTEHQLTITIKDKQTKEPLDATIIIGSKTFSINGKGQLTLAKGEYVLTASSDGYIDEQKTITLEKDTEITILLEKIPAKKLKLDVFTIDAATKQQLNALVTVNEKTQQPLNGKTSFILPQGQYTVSASHSGYQTTTEQINLQQNTKITLELKQAFIGTFALSFQVNDSITNAPIKDATINVAGNTLLTGDSGKATIVIPSGMHTFTIIANEYHPFTNTISIDKDTTVQIKLIPSGIKVQTAEFTVLDEKTLQGIENAVITFQGMSATTNNNGKASFFNTNNGTFMYEITHPLYLTLRDQTTINGDAKITAIMRRNPDKEFPDDFLKIRIEKIEIEQNRALISYKNTGTKPINNVKTIIHLLGTDIRASAGPDDIRAGQKITHSIYLGENEELSGKYIARISIGNGKHNRVIHREIDYDSIRASLYDYS
ncbi:hypothetical protein HY486_04590 [Candidatus Woesearchaeota archaeon]|nr:hypothetical protein [Candidatus Woesearchaeota archaeon]